MPGTTYTTRVYKYGAVPLGPFPREGDETFFKVSQLWNRLVEIHQEHYLIFDQERRDADEEYDILVDQLEKLRAEIKKAKNSLRAAKSAARTKSSDHPLVKTKLEDLSALYAEDKKLREEMKAPRSRATKAIDTKALSGDKRNKINEACLTKNSGLSRDCYGEVFSYFKTAETKIYKTPGSRLQFRRHDGGGYIHYRLKDETTKSKKDGKRNNQDGVTFDFLMGRGPKDARAFVLEPSKARGGVPRMKLKVLVKNSSKKNSRVYAFFDLVMHRPIPEGAQINNAKLLRRRIGDRFVYTVSFSVRVPEPRLIDEGREAIGIDIGFRQLSDGSIRAAMIGSTKKGFGFEEVAVSKKMIERLEHSESLQQIMDKSATELGEVIKPLLKKGTVLDEKHQKFKFIKGIADAPAHVTLSFEQAYKLGTWIRYDPHHLPKKVEGAALEWSKRYHRMYREMHNLRKKTFAWRKETYRILASKLVKHGYPIAFEEIDLRVFAEVKDKENELSDKARFQRFLVSNSELIGAIENAAKREGVEVIRVDAKNTSKTCSTCGVVNVKLRTEMKWKCSDCGAEHDRDENAALNIALLGQEKMAKMSAKKG
jgi:transposase